MILCAASSNARADQLFDVRWTSLTQPCAGDCAFAVYAGKSVSTNVQDIHFKAIPPWSWKYDNSGIVAGTVSRRIATVFGVFDLEGEAGVAQRFGNQDQSEGWVALYGRWKAFPWNRYLVTTVAISTGLNYATGISDFEREHGQLNPAGGTHVLHFYSPEITFALPARPDRQLVFRLHHRSGAYGVVSGAFSGATYGSVGLRFWF